MTQPHMLMHISKEAEQEGKVREPLSILRAIPLIQEVAVLILLLKD